MHLSGDSDLGENDSVLSPSASRIEAKNEAKTKEDLDNIRLLEKTSAAAATLFQDAAKTTEKESLLAEKQQEKIILSSNKLIKEMRRDRNEGIGMVKKTHSMVPEVNVDSTLAQEHPNSAHVETPRQHRNKGRLMRHHSSQSNEGENNEMGDLGESAEVATLRSRRAHNGPAQRSSTPSATLKQEQFALVNAQTELNKVTRQRKLREHRLAKKLRLKEKTAIETERLDLKADEQKYQQDANVALKATTDIDKYLAKDKSLQQQEHKAFQLMKQESDSTVHDEFIATKSAQKTLGRFKKFISQAGGLVENLHNPDLQSALNEDSKGSTSQKTQRHASKQMSDQSDEGNSISKQNPSPTPEKKVRAARTAIDKFVKSRSADDDNSQPTKVDDSQVQPTKERAMKAMKQMKRDEKNAAAYGRKLEQRDERKAGTQMPDEGGNGSLRDPNINAANAANNPQANGRF